MAEPQNLESKGQEVLDLLEQFTNEVGPASTGINRVFEQLENQGSETDHTTTRQNVTQLVNNLNRLCVGTEKLLRGLFNERKQVAQAGDRTGLEAENERLKAEVTQLKNEKAQQDAQISSLNSQVSHLQISTNPGTQGLANLQSHNSTAFATGGEAARRNTQFPPGDLRPKRLRPQGSTLSAAAPRPDSSAGGGSLFAAARPGQGNLIVRARSTTPIPLRSTPVPSATGEPEDPESLERFYRTVPNFTETRDERVSIRGDFEGDLDTFRSFLETKGAFIDTNAESNYTSAYHAIASGLKMRGMTYSASQIKEIHDSWLFRETVDKFVNEQYSDDPEEGALQRTILQEHRRCIGPVVIRLLLYCITNKLGQSQALCLGLVEYSLVQEDNAAPRYSVHVFNAMLKHRPYSNTGIVVWLFQHSTVDSDEDGEEEVVWCGFTPHRPTPGVLVGGKRRPESALTNLSGLETRSKKKAFIPGPSDDDKPMYDVATSSKQKTTNTLAVPDLSTSNSIADKVRSSGKRAVAASNSIARKISGASPSQPTMKAPTAVPQQDERFGFGHLIKVGEIGKLQNEEYLHPQIKNYLARANFRNTNLQMNADGFKICLWSTGRNHSQHNTNGDRAPEHDGMCNTCLNDPRHVQCVIVWDKTHVFIKGWQENAGPVKADTSNPQRETRRATSMTAPPGLREGRRQLLEVPVQGDHEETPEDQYT